MNQALTRSGALLVLGSINADLYVEIDRLPAVGETIAGSGAAVRPGGKGANQAAAGARLGCPTRFIGQTGDDAHAAFLHDALTATGVNTDLIQARPGPSGQAFILLQQGGDNSIVLAPGANADWAALTQEHQQAIAAAGLLLLQREVPEQVNLRAAQIARAAGVPVVLDAGGADEPLSTELLACLSILSPNETELNRLVPEASSPTAAAESLRAAGVDSLLLKCGAAGARFIGATEMTCPAFSCEVVDTTGAGDCFTAAFCVALLESRSIADALRFANAAAALCIGVKGAMPAMPSRAAVDAFLTRHVE